MEMTDVLPVLVVLMFSILPLSLDNVTSPLGSGVAVGMDTGTCGSVPPPPGTGGKGSDKRQ